MQDMDGIYRHPWLDLLVENPEKAVDSLLRGVAHLPGLQRASPCEALMALLGDLPRAAAEWQLLDREVCAWLQRRRDAENGLLARPGGVQRFIRETGEAFRAVWRLGLPESSEWIRSHHPDLFRWAETFSVDATFDLANAVLMAGAHLQKAKELRFLWFRICDAAASPRLRHRLDTALLGLIRMPCEKTAGGPSRDVVVGLARWASRLPVEDRFKAEVVREWRALKAAFPRQPKFWRGQWDAIMEDDRYNGHPFIGWLKEADPALQVPASAPHVRREPLLPRDINGTIAGMRTVYVKDGLTDQLWRQMTAMLDQIENYADVTGQSYYLVTSCTNIGNIVLSKAPGHALSLARRALLWSPSDGHAWSVRARALGQLGHDDLAISVLWEAIRRNPSNNTFYNQLALNFIARGRTAEAEVLLRKAVVIDDKNQASLVELSRLLWSIGRVEEALDLLQDFCRKNSGRVALYTLGCLLIAEGSSAEAADVLASYRRYYGDNNHSATLARLLAAGAAGREEVREHLLSERRREDFADRVDWDAIAAESALDVEMRESPRLARIGAVAEADLLFHARGGAHDKALILVDGILAADDSDTYAQLVKALGVPGYGLSLEGRGGRFAGSLPLQLALIAADAPQDRWQDLAQRFPEGKPLIDLVHLARGNVGDDVRQRLEAWTSTPPRWDDGWGKFVKREVKAHLDNEGKQTVTLDLLAHDALTQAVDVGWDVTPMVA